MFGVVFAVYVHFPLRGGTAAAAAALMSEPTVDGIDKRWQAVSLVSRFV